jgi:hypothetical protein
MVLERAANFGHLADAAAAGPLTPQELARPPQPMNAMFNLLLRFWPRRMAGAALIAPAARVRPTN